MLKIGITGGIGSGKSTVCRIFEILGIPVFYADDVAKNLMTEDEELKKGIIAHFGSESYLPDGGLNRTHLAGIVFNNDQELEKLNALVHPAVFRAFDAWAAQQNAPYVIKEAALLFESGSHQMCDQTILVTAPDDLKMKRIMKRDGLSKTEVQARMAKQMSDEDKKPLASLVLNNNEKELLIPQILQLHQQFLQGGKN